jgi:DNA (cytosine-5)-methyltransferase 1
MDRLYIKRKIGTSNVKQEEPPLCHVNGYPWAVFGSHLSGESGCKYTHVSLFSGCGGFDLGFRAAGFKTVFANDNNPDACQTYKKNIGEIVCGDIGTISLPRFSTRPDVLSAGFPCQPFSNAGSRKGLDDIRGILFKSALHAVEKIKPRTVVFENVRGILSFKIGKKLLIQEICDHLERLGYNVIFSLLDASNHNVPQRRLRLFIVGTENRRATGRFLFPEISSLYDMTLGNTILDISPDAPNQTELMRLNPQAIRIGSMVPEGGSWKDIPYRSLPDRLKRINDNMARYRWPNFYRRFHRDEIAGTITAAFKPENAGVWHPVENRVLSVREIARIQSFPDWFRFEGRSIKSKYQQIGNAVAPRLSYEIAQQIVKSLQGDDQWSKRASTTFADFIKSGRPLRVSDKNIVYRY